MVVGVVIYLTGGGWEKSDGLCNLVWSCNVVCICYMHTDGLFMFNIHMGF